MNNRIPEHPLEQYLRMDRIPHIWCSGCGLGTEITCFMKAIEEADISPDKIVVVSGIGCSGRIAGYMKFDSFHTTHGRAVPFATGVKLANPELTVIVFSGDGDLFSIGGNHFIHAARRNVDIKVFCVNNFIYGMTGGQVAPTTPLHAKTSTSPYGCFEPPFNLPYLAESSGAVYVARWTPLHIRRLTHSMSEAIAKKGFSFIEMVSPCPTVYSRYNRLGDGLDMIKYYRENSRIENGADTKSIPLEIGKEIVVGKFVDIEKPTFLDYQTAQVEKNEAKM
ncbi:MAG: 2-oxoacid:ferredoxin oxidoreductase subunit beta [Candidatus Omnitrophota bacterium]|nr:MAG: 2-oxoacid:ferredoxin oxidoreductase subunit beta [Candidatus Omnitrophota bacterium]